MHALKIILFIILLSLLIIPLVFAGTWHSVINVGATNGTEAFISEEGGGTNYGGSDYFSFGTSDLPNIVRALLNFSFLTNDVIPSGATIDTFIIELQLTDWSQTTEENSRMYPVNRAWNETDVTWNDWNSGGVNMTDYNGTKDLIASYSPSNPSANQRVNFTIDSDFAQDFFDGNEDNWDEGVIFILTTEGTLESHQVGFWSGDYATAAAHPSYYIEYTEEPSEDTCSCPSREDHWNIDCSDNCIITEDCSIGDNDVHTYGSGTLTIKALIDARNIFNRCDLFCYNTPSCFG